MFYSDVTIKCDMFGVTFAPLPYAFTDKNISGSCYIYAQMELTEWTHDLV